MYKGSGHPNSQATIQKTARALKAGSPQATIERSKASSANCAYKSMSWSNCSAQTGEGPGQSGVVVQSAVLDVGADE